MTTKNLDELNIPGIYMLRWDDTYFYIGKSVNIRDRILQHLRSFEDGTAASKLQWAYDSLGVPSASILLECHADNIDVLEAYFINLLKDNYMLNTSMLPEPFQDIPEEVVESILDTFCKRSLGQISRDLHIAELKNKSYEIEIAELRDEVDTLSRKRSEEELRADVSGMLEDLRADVAYYRSIADEAEARVENLKEEITYIRKLPWYKKLFIKAP